MIEPEDEPPICEWCNRPVVMYGELCSVCDNARQEREDLAYVYEDAHEVESEHS